MKTIIEIDKEIAKVLSSYNKDDLVPEKRKKEKLYNYLRTCKFYLETFPREEFIKKEISRLNLEVGAINSRFDLWKSTLTMTEMSKIHNLSSHYKRINEIPLKLKQINTLKYLLD